MGEDSVLWWGVWSGSVAFIGAGDRRGVGWHGLTN